MLCCHSYKIPEIANDRMHIYFPWDSGGMRGPDAKRMKKRFGFMEMFYTLTPVEVVAQMYAIELRT